MKIIILSSFVISAASALAAADALPLAEDFSEGETYRNGDLAGQRGWSVEQGVAQVKESDGIRYLEISAAPPHGQASLYFAKTVDGPPVFLDILVRLGAEEEALELVDANGSVTGMLRLDGAGRLMALHRGSDQEREWLDTSVRVALDSDGVMRDWTRLTFRQDHARGSWDLYVNGALRAANLGLAPDSRESGGYFTLMGGKTHPVRLRKVAVDTRNMLFEDADADGLPDDWQRKLISGARDADADADGLSNLEEYIHGTDAGSADTDKDGWTDADEIGSGSDPLKADRPAPSEGLSVEFRLTDAPHLANPPRGLYECRRDGVFRRAPSLSLPVTRLEFNGLLDDHFTSRVRGKITAPVTGDYTFWVAGDDSAEFALGEDETPFRRRVVARCPSYTEALDFDRFASQKSVTIRLTAGKSYYFELLHQEDSGKDHFAVAWQIPGGSRSVISGRHLSAWQVDPQDLNDDGLPDAWQVLKGLQIDSPESLSEADPDGDRLTNLEEYRVGSDPKVADAEGRPGLITREVWFGMPGRYLFDAARAGNFPLTPWWIEYQESFESPRDIGTDFLARTRGWVVVPETGTYTFHLSADDQAELWLSESAEKFAKRKIAWLPLRSDWHQWDRYPSQKSVPLTLREGQAIYIETLHKQGGGDSHLSVAWTKPGAIGPQVITGANLMSWRKSDSDTDDDDLPDAWQTTNGLTADPETLKEMPGYAKKLSAWGDLDGDGVLNGEERLAGTKPDDASSHPQVGLQWQIWRNHPGTNLSALEHAADFPASPWETKNLTELDYSGQGTNYISRARGFLTPPLTGEYVFSISGGDNCQLWLSSDESRFRRDLIAQVDLMTAWRDKDYNTRQRSKPIRLESGKKYYLEILHKKGLAERDHLAVGWEVPGVGQSVITRDFLLPYADDPADADDDGLPDEWETARGLRAGAATATGSFGDPDGDLMSNFLEWRQGTDPLTADRGGQPGLLLWEAWEGVSGVTLDRLLGNHRFPAQPDRRALVAQGEVPADRGSWQGSRLRGYLVPPVSGRYRIMVAGDDETRLLIGTGVSKFSRAPVASVPFWSNEREYTRYPEQSAELVFEAGKRYYFELLQKEGDGRNHASLAWLPPGAEAPEIPSGSAIAAFGTDPDDLDDDELPDDWETGFDLDPLDNGNLDFAQGPWGDPDGDRLTNLEEWKLGTNPRDADSDGDGMDDGLERFVTRTNPAVRDEKKAEPAARVALGSGTVIRGNAEALYEGLKTGSMTGEVALPFTLVSDGGAWFRLTASVIPQPSGTPLSLRLSIDGMPLGSLPLMQTSDQSGTVAGRLPYLLKGVHSVRVAWEIPEAGKALYLEDLEIFQSPAADAPDGENQIVSAAAGEVTESLTSPYCLEGTATHPALVRLNVPVTARALPDAGWHANVPLPDNGDPLDITATFENGLSTRSTKVSWKACNVLESGNLRIRAGDALRLIALPPGGGAPETARVTISVNGAVTAIGAADDPVEHVFDQPGVYKVATEFFPGAGPEGRLAKTMEVEAVKASAPELVSILAGQPRKIAFPGFPEEADADASADASLFFREQAGETVRTFTLSRSTVGDGLIAVRLPGKGPVLTTVAVRALSMSIASETGYRVAGTFPDGTLLIEVGVFLPGLTPGMRVRVDILAAGVTFEDGSVSKWLTAADFDSNGLAKIRFLMAPGVQTSFCHSLTLFDGDAVIGTR